MPIVENSTLSLDATRGLIELRASRNVLMANPLPAELRESFFSVIHRAVPADDHGWTMSPVTESLLAPALTIANAGLLDAAHYATLRLGYVPRITLDPVRPLPPSCLQILPFCLRQIAHVARLIYEKRQGLIRHHLSQAELALVIAQLASEFSDTRISVVAATRDRARRFHRHLSTYLRGATLASATSCRSPGGRVVVSTLYGLMHHDVMNHNPHAMLFLDAAEAVSERGQLALIGVEFARAFALLDDGRWLPPRLNDLITAAFGFDEVALPRIGCQNRQVEVAWHRFDIPCQRDKGPDPQNYVRDLIWRDPIRNRLIARLARGLANGTEWPVQALPSAPNETASAGGTRTLIVTESLEHAVRLARRLNHWPVVTGPHVTVAGLSRNDHRILRTWPRVFDGQKAIATATGLDTIPLDQVDVIVWAGAGPRPAPLPLDRLICEAGRQHRLVLVDFCDHHHPLLRRWTGRRQAGYERLGWFPVGLSPVVGRIKRFLADRPENHRGRL